MPSLRPPPLVLRSSPLLLMLPSASLLDSRCELTVAYELLLFNEVNIGPCSLTQFGLPSDRFGLIGDGTSYSEGAAYGTDQSKPLYSPYSVYSPTGKDSAYQEDNPEYTTRKKEIIAESKKRLGRLDGYIDKKKWYEVRNELDRYMYETRGAVRGLAKTTQQKAAATEFFQSIEETNLNATLKKQDACKAAAKESIAKLDAFVATL